jgi:hypothetical protein
MASQNVPSKNNPAENVPYCVGKTVMHLIFINTDIK